MQEPVVEHTFERALDTILMRVFYKVKGGDVFSGAEKFSMAAIAVAYSGGLDSTVLLHCAQRFAAEKNIRLFAFHVHHGLNPKADAWLNHCEATCMEQGIRFESRKVKVKRGSGDGIEAEARAKRYAALGEMCRKHQITLLLTAHHEDDQVETVLMHLMRGTGIAGLAGMDWVTQAPELLGDTKTWVGRPFLSLSREELASWAGKRKLTYVEDDSNNDTRYTRNAIRHRLVPVLSDMFPGFGERLSRMAQHARSAHHVLNETGRQDLDACRVSRNVLDMVKAGKFGPDRMDNLFRYWLVENGIRIPSASWYRQARKQIENSSPDAQVDLPLEGYTLRKYRSRVFLEKNDKKRMRPVASAFIRWNGECAVRLEPWYGTLLFEECDNGLDSEWLKNRVLRIDPYRGNAQLKLRNRPTKKLKILCQEAGIPLWERVFLPMIYIEDELVFVGGVGQSVKKAGIGKKCVRFRWEPAA